jgi:hypothetical protein
MPKTEIEYGYVADTVTSLPGSHVVELTPTSSTVRPMSLPAFATAVFAAATGSAASRLTIATRAPERTASVSAR